MIGKSDRVQKILECGGGGVNRKMATKSRIVAFSAVSAALGTVFLTIGAYTGLGEFF
ncbi:MAG: hypothetical protein HN948_02595 [Clostridia bacterium]|jgi:hypothetical protein|nr:hypothetical protein [Clostridia bacterium]